jgi:CarD family transcriptional regulator
MSSLDLNFHIGDKVVYPNHGVGVIEQISSRSIGTTVERFYLLNTNGNGDWKDRFKENSDRMRTGSLLEVAGVLKSLIALHQAKPLSFREKKMLERARYLLVSELAMARNCEEAKVEELLTTALAKCKLRFPEASEFQA